MRFLYTFILLLCALTARAAADATESSACPPLSVMLANGNVDKQKAMGEEYRNTKYWRRHRRYKTAAYCVLGVGACATLMGIRIVCSDWGEWEEAQPVFGAAFIGGGVIIGAASIPLFVAAHRNKKKAKNAVSLSLNCSTATTPVARGARHRSPMLGACLNF